MSGRLNGAASAGKVIDSSPTRLISRGCGRFDNAEFDIATADYVQARQCLPIHEVQQI